MKITVKPVCYRGHMTEKKLERYARDPNVFVIYNVFHHVRAMFERIQNDKYPSFEESFRIRPLSFMYDKNSKESRVDTLCVQIDAGVYILCRLVTNAN